ncbi:MAG: AMP-binding protein [Desulfobacteraceae bacterium]|nr:AMP-binding protein [Desulfobacteraceae bacterium]MBC2754248.1 AMP-binding protein [Desulfobacteraceae bacterium]
MSGEKSLKTVSRAMKTILKTEEHKGFNRAIRKQWGVLNIFRVLSKTASLGGFRNNLKAIKEFKTGSIAANFFIALWESLGDREAIIDGDKRISYAQMGQRVLRLANALQDLGVEKKDRVACMLYNSAEYFECFYAACIIGSPLPAVNWHLTGDDLRSTIDLRKPKVLIFDEDFADEIIDYQNDMPSVEHFIMVGGSPPDGIVNYETLLSESRSSLPKTSFIFAMNPYTGGTTGSPKSSNLYDGMSYLLSELAEAPRASLDEYVQYMNRQFSYLYHYGGDKIRDSVGKNIRTLIPTPMYHAGTAAGFAPCIMLGATAVPMRKFDPESYLKMVEKERISWSFVVPTIIQRILGLPDHISKKYDLSSMHTLISAAAPCPPEAKTAINKLFMAQGADKPVFHEFYGSSESALLTLLLPDDYIGNPERINSVGKPRCGDILVYDEIAQKPSETGKDGMIFGRSVATMSLRYPGTEKKLKDSQRIIDGKEWYDDGLIGHQDEDGFLYLTSRVKEMIICAGVNIFPVEIERFLFINPKIYDAAVIRVPHPDLGEIPLACIQLKEGETLTEKEIQDYCKEKGLKGYKVPQKVEFYEKLPRHIDGKIIKRDLEEKYWEGHERLG